MRRRLLMAVATAAWVATGLTLAGAADAKTFRFSTSGDVNGLDPHLNNETPTNAMKHNLYEALVYRNDKLQVEPALATEWSQTSPTTWRFRLRRRPAWLLLGSVQVDQGRQRTPAATGE